jgi:hypothetical protein
MRYRQGVDKGIGLMRVQGFVILMELLCFVVLSGVSDQLVAELCEAGVKIRVRA